MLTTALALLLASPSTTPILELTKDNTQITHSCVIRVSPDTIIHDADHNGILHIAADNITVEFEKGSVLRGSEINDNWDKLTGTGIRIDTHKNVTIRLAELSGFKVGIFATHADNLTLDSLNLHDGYRQRLKSTPQKEHNDDWMFPHNNDQRQWMSNHGGAIVVERSTNITISNTTVRTTQNGFILDRVNNSAIFDNDASFLSGWGLAMWRSSDNTITRNAFDFCVRGHSEGVYNRGQDSAGILLFEQSSRNTFAQNSATHGGDGFFGFAGKEALGETPHNPEDGPFDPTSAGCNDNLLINNDFSYAPAHGIELTFSSGNKFIRNRLVENAICGIWAGYARNTLIAENNIARNGGMAYGLERGGINIEHGSDNTIISNTFTNNRCAIHLWWDNDGKLLETPLVKANDKGVSNNRIIGNTFTIDADHPFTRDRDKDKPLIVLQLRDLTPDAQPRKVKDNVYHANQVSLSAPNAKEFDITKGCDPIPRAEPLSTKDEPNPRILGNKQPVGARPHLRGRDKIIMTEWGPWDHTGPTPSTSQK